MIISLGKFFVIYKWSNNITFCCTLNNIRLRPLVYSSLAWQPTGFQVFPGLRRPCNWTCALCSCPYYQWVRCNCVGINLNIKHKILNIKHKLLKTIFSQITIYRAYSFSPERSTQVYTNTWSWSMRSWGNRTALNWCAVWSSSPDRSHRTRRRSRVSASSTCASDLCPLDNDLWELFLATSTHTEPGNSSVATDVIVIRTKNGGVYVIHNIYVTGKYVNQGINVIAW